MDNCFWYDGTCSLDVGVRLRGPVRFSGAEPRGRAVAIPGRNGELHITDGSYENRAGWADCYILREDAAPALDQVNRWAFLTPGYRRLETPEEPDHYRMARVSAGPETEPRLGLLAPFTLGFDCMPQRFFKRGDVPVRMRAPGRLYNHGFPARPHITVYGEGPGTLAVGNTLVQIKALEGWLELDCERQDVYKGPENKNSAVHAPEFPILPPGETGLSWTGGITQIEIKPRWWTL